MRITQISLFINDLFEDLCGQLNQLLLKLLAPLLDLLGVLHDFELCGLELIHLLQFLLLFPSLLLLLLLLHPRQLHPLQLFPERLEVLSPCLLLIPGEFQSFIHCVISSWPE